MEFGLYTFVDNTSDPETGQKLSPTERLSNLIEEITLADQAGLEVFGIGEHHREEYLSSSPSTILAAAVMRTQQIRLTSAVTVLSSEDPVRVYQQYATLDLLSQGRAELMVGRGSFIESFPLFGYDLDDYDELFAEKLGLLLALRNNAPITWKGQHRPSMVNQPVYPHPVQSPLPVWVVRPSLRIWQVTSASPWPWRSLVGSPNALNPLPTCTGGERRKEGIRYCL